jgi:hypothetical protein
MAKSCVTQAMVGSMDDYRLILMPKQGFGIVKKDSDDLKAW